MKSGAVFRGVALAAGVSLPGAMTLGAMTLPARAADISTARPAPAPPPSTYIPAPFFWTGYYLGLAAGDGWGSAPFTDPFPHTNFATATGSSKGLHGGGVTGINYQIGWVVIGAEFDFMATFMKSAILDSANTNLQTSVFWTSTVTGRLGLAFDKVLVFGKGGGAFAYDRDTVISSNSGGNTGSAIGSANRTGWTVGGGVDYAITEHWIAGVEYDYLKFASKAINFTGPPANNISGNVALSINEVRGVIAYKF